MRPPDGIKVRERAEAAAAARRERERADVTRRTRLFRRRVAGRLANRPAPGQGGEVYRRRVYDDTGAVYDLVIEVRFGKLAGLFWRAVRSPLGAVALAHGAIVIRAERQGGRPAHVGGPYAQAGPREAFRRQLFADERYEEDDEAFGRLWRRKRP